MRDNMPLRHPEGTLPLTTVRKRHRYERQSDFLSGLIAALNESGWPEPVTGSRKERLRLEDLAIDDGAAEGEFVGVLEVVAETKTAGQ